jgi:hypothetical protein
MEKCRQLISENAVKLECYTDSDLTATKRILHILNLILRLPDFPAAAFPNVNSMLTSMLHQPPWNSEGVILDLLQELRNICLDYVPDSPDIAKAFMEDLTDIPLQTEINLSRLI